MSYKILKTIDMDLTPGSINRAIREVKRFQQQLRDSCWELVEKLTMEGCEIAKMQVTSLDAVDTGELESSIHGVFFPGERCGFVVADTPYAIYVEYGTGIEGASEPHPEAAGNWDYDANRHGIEGWVYRDDKDGKFHWTCGYISRPFMYHTLKWLEEAAPERASELWAQM